MRGIGPLVARDHRNNQILAMQQENATIAGNSSFVGGPGSYHTGLFNVLLGDGSARSISMSIDANTLRKLAHRADGELIATPF